MRDFLNKLVVFTALGLAANVGMAATAKSTGTFLTTCSFGSSTDGVLKLVNGKKTISSATANGGTPPTFNITYFGQPVVSLTQPTVTSTYSNPAPPTYTIAVSSSSGVSYTVLANGSATGTYATGTSDQVTVSQTATYSAIVTPGDYTITQVATCQ